MACNEAALITAINTTQTAGGGTIPLTPGCTYTLTTSHGAGTNGPDGLPIIHTVLALTGTNNMITRASGDTFRIAEVSNTGNFTLQGVTLNNGLTAGDGGGILNFGAVTLTGSILINNTATGRGGGLYNGLRGTLTMTSTPVTFNRSAAKGGGIAAINSAATTLTSSPVSANTAALGAGGIFRFSGVMTITTSPITGNTPNNCVGSSPAVPSCTN